MTNSSEAPTLAVVIPCFNCGAVLERCVRSLLHSAADCPNVQSVLLVDGGSSDDTSQVCDRLEELPLVRILRHERSSTSAKRNHAAQQSTEDFLVFTDPDCIATPGWLPAYAEAARTWRYCTGRVSPYGEGVHTSVRGYPRDHTFHPGFLYRAFPFRPGSSNNVMIERALLLELGGFREDLGPGTPNDAGEDADLNYRVLRAGIPIRYVVRAEVQHDHAETEAVFLKKKTSYARGLSYLLFRYYAADPATWFSFKVMMAHSLARLAWHGLTRNRLRTRQAWGEVRGRVQGAVAAIRAWQKGH